MAISCQVFAAVSELIDPTMPSADTAAVEENTESSNKPVLQSVLMSKRRNIAIISGKAFVVGDKVGDTTLIKINDHEAILRNNDRTMQTLNMHPGVVKKLIPQPLVRPSAKHRLNKE